jgi:hypothetical protein
VSGAVACAVCDGARADSFCDGAGSGSGGGAACISIGFNCEGVTAASSLALIASTWPVLRCLTVTTPLCGSVAMTSRSGLRPSAARAHDISAVAFALVGFAAAATDADFGASPRLQAASASPATTARPTLGERRRVS